MKLPAKAPLLFGAKNYRDWVEIELPGGRKLMAQFIGRGKFSNVFVNSLRQIYIYTQHGDLSKDILSHIDWRSNSHIPMMRWVGSMSGCKIDVYLSRYYHLFMGRRVTPEHKEIVKELRRLHKEAASVFTGDIIAKDQCIDFNYYIAEHARVPDKLKEALMLITESAQDWGKHYLFDDFRNKNLGLTAKGHLVFIDPVFNAELLQKERG